LDGKYVCTKITTCSSPPDQQSGLNIDGEKKNPRARLNKKETEEKYRFISKFLSSMKKRYNFVTS
jgi:hypothetical protein